MKDDNFISTGTRESLASFLEKKKYLTPFQESRCHIKKNKKYNMDIES